MLAHIRIYISLSLLLSIPIALPLSHTLSCCVISYREVSCRAAPRRIMSRPASCILHPASCILHPASCVLRPASCVLHPASCVLYSVLSRRVASRHVASSVMSRLPMDVAQGKSCKPGNICHTHGSMAPVHALPRPVPSEPRPRTLQAPLPRLYDAVLLLLQRRPRSSRLETHIYIYIYIYIYKWETYTYIYIYIYTYIQYIVNVYVQCPTQNI